MGVWTVKTRTRVPSSQQIRQTGVGRGKGQGRVWTARAGQMSTARGFKIFLDALNQIMK